MAPTGGKPTSIPIPQAAENSRISHAIFRIARLHRILTGQLLRQAGLHPGQEAVMMHLWGCGPQRLTDLCNVLGADSPTMTRTVQRLERGGFVRRSPDPTDGRAVIVEPTAASQGLRHEVERVWREVEEATIGDMDDEQQAETLNLLSRLECNLATRMHRPVPGQDGTGEPPA